jgi:hypothetical protein
VPGWNTQPFPGLSRDPSGAGPPHDKLAALLWPDAPAERARHSLRRTLVNLRQVLPPGALVEVGNTIAVAGADAVDVADFERAVIEGTLDALARAADLYRGAVLAGLGPRASLRGEPPQRAGAARALAGCRAAALL